MKILKNIPGSENFHCIIVEWKLCIIWELFLIFPQLIIESVNWFHLKTKDFVHIVSATILIHMFIFFYLIHHILIEKFK